MRRILVALVVGSALWIGGGAARGQSPAGSPVLPYRVQAYYSAPGYYGTTYGVASYGVRQTYSTFSSPYGPGYATGYPPANYLPGPWGTTMWNRGAASAGQAVWRTPYYGTYAIPAAPAGVAHPPIGAYATGFGPGIAPGFSGW